MVIYLVYALVHLLV